MKTERVIRTKYNVVALKNYRRAAPSTATTGKEMVIKMGKAKRSKDKRAAAQLNNPAAAVENRSSGLALKIALAVIALIVVASLVFAFIQSSGLLLRADYGYKSENFEINGAMMQYLYNTQIHNFVEQYYTYFYYYSLMGQTIVDFSKSLDTQKFSATAQSLFGAYDGTWGDFFWTSTEAAAKQVLVLCEAAKAEGLYDKYAEEIEKTVDEDIKASKEASKEYYPSLNSYFEYLYGEGVKSSDVRKMEILAQVAAKYYADKSEDYLEAITKDDVLKYHEENSSKYLKIDYLAASFSATLPSKATEDEKKEFLAEVEESKKHAEAFAKLETIEEMKKYLVGYWFDSSFDDYLDSALKSDKVKEDELPTEEKRAELKAKIREMVLEKAMAEKFDTTKDGTPFKKDEEPLALTLNTVFQSLVSTSRTSLEKVMIETEAFAESTDKDKWIFAEDRKEGDIGTFYGTEEKTEDKFDAEKDTSYVVNVFRVTKPAYRQEELTVNFGHILLLKSGGAYTDDTKRVEKLNEIMEQFKKGELTAERFEELGKDVTEDSKVLYENVKPDAMVEEINEWLFDDKRVKGDVEIVKTADYGHHLVFFNGESDAIWFVDTKADLHNERVEGWYEEQEKAIEKTLDLNKGIKGKIGQSNSIASYGGSSSHDGHDH